ncbi:MAG: hypothetical protein JNK37_05800 [Verrucomicrobiales bacterium]|nr:hypothetical protein [Verrucomicrobiales bacterium]
MSSPRLAPARLACFLGLCLSSYLMTAAAAPRDAQWQQVETHLGEARPQSAIEVLTTIEAAAKADKAWPELAKAVAYRISAETQIQGHQPEERIRRYETALADAPAEIAPILRTLLASSYWTYFQQNRWRILQRTRTTEAPGDDFQTWDLPRLLTEIDTRYRSALEKAAALQQIPIADFDTLLIRGNVPDRFRPTLYDFLAHEALAFYTAGEQAGAAPQDAYDFDAASPALGTMAEFLAWQPASTDTASPKLRAIALYQDLLRFHTNDADASARVLIDLDRIAWAAGVATGDQAAPRARAQLTALLATHGDTEAGVAVAAALADRLMATEEFVEARRIAAAAAERHPDSIFAANCRNLLKQIEAPDLQVGTEQVWNAAGPEIAITYRNIAAVHFRLVPREWSFGERRWQSPLHVNHEDIAAALKQPPAVSWKSDLEKTADYRQRTVRVPAPAGQQPGFYLLIASHAADFAERDNLLAAQPVWVSPLALITRQAPDGAEGFVLDALSGEPIAGAEVEVWSLDNNGRWNRDAFKKKTDAMGFFEEKAKDRPVLFLARHQGHAVSSDQLHFWRSEREIQPVRTYLFTDRSLYRPGQTIRFKGIHIHADTEKNDYHTLKNKTLAIRLLDANGEEVEVIEVKTNDRGGFSGSFTAPKGRVTGRLTIAEGDRGAVSVSMEEYKRPKFQVTLEPPAVSPKLGEAVSLKGRADSYAGAPIDGAAVRWRVTREARWPGWLRWCGWFFPPATQGAREIANGVATTGADGRFELAFTAEPDRSLEEKAEPSFVFTVHADITDTAGETRSASKGVTIGYTALQADLSASEWQTVAKPVDLTVRTTSLDGDPLTATGTITVHRLQAPDRVHRPRLSGRPWQQRPAQADEPDLSDPNQWPLGDVVQRDPFQTDEQGRATVEVKLAAGEYRAVLETKDRNGRAVTALLPIRVLDPAAATFPIRVAHHLSAENWTLEPGQTLEALWGTGYGTGRAFVEVEHRGKIVRRYWTEPGRTQQGLAVPVTEKERGGFTLHVTQIRENRAHLTSRSVSVPWSNKDYSLRWERMRDKLEPGSQETWTLVVEGAAKDEPVELVAAMYDASLDAFLPHGWQNGFHAFYHDYSNRSGQFHNAWISPLSAFSHWAIKSETEPQWRHFLPQLMARGPVYGYRAKGMVSATARHSDEHILEERALSIADGAPMAAPAAPAAAPVDAFAAGGAGAASAEAPAEPAAGGAPIDWSQVGARKNLDETAFFYPHLLADESGTVRLEFTMPEALTTWKFLGFAHDRQLRAGLLTGETVTAKDLMVQPNPPRFLREGDTVEFTVKVTNKAAQPVTGKVRLEFSDAASLADANPALGNATPEQTLDLPASGSRTYSWRLTVPDGQGFLQYRAVASTGTVSDGEEGWLPVLSRRILLTESITLPIRDAGEKTFTLPKLLDSAGSGTLQHRSLTAQVVSQPAWYAVQSLPYLMEYPHECAEQVFNRLYANALARHIANSNPKIRRVFDLWREAQPEALDSPLLKNDDLKSVLVEETPWLRDAKDETQARRNVGILFEANRLQAETASALAKLESMQIDNGAWPWFPGGRENEFITLYLVSGFGRLIHLGVDIDDRLALRALDRLDAWLHERHQHYLRQKIEHLGTTEALYLYARSFYLVRRPVAPEYQPAVDFFRGLARRDWPGLPRLSQAHIALGLKRFGDAETPGAIVASLLERSVNDDELGRYWRDTEQHWWWYRAPIETQAMMIEALREIPRDQTAADDCRVWLLKQRQTQAWPSTKSTADAIYALLLGGDDLLGSDALVTLTLGDTAVKPENVEAGTGFYEKRLTATEIRPEMGRVTLTKPDKGVSWGSLHWQYLEDIAKVTPHQDNPLTLKKSLFLRTHGKAGPELKAVAAGQALKPGDELVTRVELRTDRDLEYVHLKDQRGSGTEPVNVLSGYRFQDGLAYYESTRDTASHFFIEYLPKGTYVFETTTRVQLRGRYQSGVAEIQCLYAPEFNSHSGSLELRVE